MSALDTIISANQFPYDDLSRWEDGKYIDVPVVPPADWAHSAARGVIYDLGDRRGIKHALADVDVDVRQEIVATLAEIIRVAHETAGGVVA